MVAAANTPSFAGCEPSPAGVLGRTHISVPIWALPAFLACSVLARRSTTVPTAATTSPRLSRRARELLMGLPPGLRVAVVHAMDRLALDPRREGKPLRGRMRGTWVTKVGSYRILYTIEGDEPSVTVVVRAVLHRSLAYRQR